MICLSARDVLVRSQPEFCPGMSMLAPWVSDRINNEKTAQLRLIEPSSSGLICPADNFDISTMSANVRPKIHLLATRSGSEYN